MNIMNLEESLAALARPDAIVLADSVVPADGTQSVLTGRRSSRLGLRQRRLDRRGQRGGGGRGRVRR